MITKRIKKIVSMINNYDTLCDIGADHGYVIKHAFDLNKISSAIAVDINKEPLENAKANLTKYPVKFVLSNGFNNVRDDFDLCVIAGMGGIQIIEILKKRPNINADYILVAHNNVHILRKELENLNLYIVDETIEYEKGHYYQMIKVRNGHNPISDKQCYIGVYLSSDLIAKKYYQNEIEKQKELLDKVPENKKVEIKKIIKYYEEGIQYIKQ